MYLSTWNSYDLLTEKGSTLRSDNPMFVEKVSSLYKIRLFGSLSANSSFSLLVIYR